MRVKERESGSAAAAEAATEKKEVHSPNRLDAIASRAPLQTPQWRAVERSSVLSIVPTGDDVIPGVFSLERSGIFINNPSPEMLASFSRDLSASISEPGLIATIVIALGDTWGKPVASLAGFVPVDGGGVIYDDFLLFGRIYMPEVDGCRAVFRLSRKTEQAVDIKISLSGFAGGEGRKLWCSLSQEDELHASPKDLVIPVKAKVITWRRHDGRSFNTVSILNYGKSIVTKPARNPFFGSSGYDHLDSTIKGSVDRVHGGYGLGELKREVGAGIRRSYALKTKLAFSSGHAVELEGQVEVLSEISVLYVLAPTHDYLRIEGEQSPVEHYWAWREASALGK